jgi:hypothetical protein
MSEFEFLVLAGILLYIALTLGDVKKLLVKLLEKLK